MKKYKLANTDLDVSRIAYGTWHLGGSWDKTPLSEELKKRASRLIETATEAGINHIDLADIYTMGKSDEAVGYALKQNPALRDKLILEGKCGIILADNPSTGEPARYDLSYDHITSAVEGTLKRLGTDRLELLAFHRPDPLMEPEELAKAVDDLHTSGKVRYFGVSNHNWAQIALLQKYLRKPLVVNQVELSLMHHYLVSDGILCNTFDSYYTGSTGTLDYCRLHDIKIQAWSPLAGGAMFNQRDDAGLEEKSVAEEINKLAKKYDTTQEAIALAWLLKHPAGIQPIIGTLNEKRLLKSAQADSIEITRAEWFQLFEKARLAKVP